MTNAGRTLLEQSHGVLRARAAALRGGRFGHLDPRLGTGNSVARTLVADWLTQLARPRRPDAI